MNAHRTLTILAAVAFVGTLGASRAEAQPPQTTIVHAIHSQGRLYISWNAAPTAQQYNIWVTDSAEVVKVNQWLGLTNAGCPTNVGVCSAYLDVTLPAGLHYAWIDSYNPNGYAVWSPRYDFYVPPTTAVIVDATGKLLGTLLDSQQVLRSINGNPTMVTVIGLALQSGMTINLFYTTSNCTGTAYTYGTVPDRVEFTNSFANGYLRTGTLANRQIESEQQRNGATNALSACDSTISQQQHTMPVVNYNGTAEFGSLVGPFRAVYR